MIGDKLKEQTSERADKRANTMTVHAALRRLHATVRQLVRSSARPITRSLRNGNRHRRAQFSLFDCGRQKAAPAFTLMELLVVLGIFTMTVMAATDILMLNNRAQAKVFAMEKAQADARYTLEAMTREVRASTIDYDWYTERAVSHNESPVGQTEGPLNTLALRSEDGLREIFYVSSDAGECGTVNNTPCVMVDVDGTKAPITPKGIRARYARFYLYPQTDTFRLNPATGEFGANIQPRVTMVLVLETSVDRESAVVHFQTTATARSYRR